MVRVTVHVRPDSSRTHVGGEHDGALVVRVTAPAEQGKATAAVREALADALGVPLRAVTLVFGAASRRKVVGVAVPDADVDALRARLARLRDDG
jgi:uncharacterized protein YggU (UPF0235/DUF167 family)